MGKRCSNEIVDVFFAPRIAHINWCTRCIMLSEKREIVKKLDGFIGRQRLQNFFSLGFSQHVDNLACRQWIANHNFLPARFHHLTIRQARSMLNPQKRPLMALYFPELLAIQIHPENTRRCVLVPNRCVPSEMPPSPPPCASCPATRGGRNWTGPRWSQSLDASFDLRSRSLCLPGGGGHCGNQKTEPLPVLSVEQRVRFPKGGNRVQHLTSPGLVLHLDRVLRDRFFGMDNGEMNGRYAWATGKMKGKVIRCSTRHPGRACGCEIPRKRRISFKASALEQRWREGSPTRRRMGLSSASATGRAQGPDRASLSSTRSTAPIYRGCLGSSCTWFRPGILCGHSPSTLEAPLPFMIGRHEMIIRLIGRLNMPFG